MFKVQGLTRLIRFSLEFKILPLGCNILPAEHVHEPQVKSIQKSIEHRKKNLSLSSVDAFPRTGGGMHCILQSDFFHCCFC